MHLLTQLGGVILSSDREGEFAAHEAASGPRSGAAHYVVVATSSSSARRLRCGRATSRARPLDVVDVDGDARTRTRISLVTPTQTAGSVN